MRIIGFILLAGISNLMGATAEDRRPAMVATAQVPLSFERATSGNTRWTARGNGYRLAVGAADVEVGLRDEQLRILFVGANAKAPSEGLNALAGKVNYFVGNDPKRWLRDIPTYGRVRYSGVYPGVDMVWYGKQGRLEYDLGLQPGADASRIAMRFEGARKMAVEASGDLRVEMAGGSLSLKLPEVYQEGSGGRKRIGSRYELRAGNEVGFHLGAYDKSRPLVIDPTLVYGSYLGSAFSINAMTTDILGNVYVGGYAGAGLATVNAFQPGMMGGSDAFVMKFDPTGTTVLYSTYIGGSSFDEITSVAVDSSGELVATGTTDSKDFPLVNAAWSTFDTSSNQNAIVLRLSADGSTLVYSTYLSSRFGATVALDGSGSAYVAGDTDASAVATSGAWQTVYGGGFQDAFVAKLGPAGALVYLTFLGGSGYDEGTQITVDSLGNAYVTGYTDSVSFPNSPPGVHTTNSGGQDVFIAKVSSDGSSVPWLTFLGGTGDDETSYSGTLVRDSSSGILYVAGSTTSADLPTTAGVLQPSPNGPAQGFVASVNPDGMSFGFVTYLGGRKEDSINAITETPSGQLVVAGSSSSYDLASVSAIQPAFVGNGISLFESANSGGSWTASDSGLPASVLALAGDPSSATTILALSPWPLSVFRTTNGGASWLAEPLSGHMWSWLGSPAFSFFRSPANPSVVYVYFPFSEGPPPDTLVFRSVDDGATWTGLTNPDSSEWMDGVAFSATDANTLVEVFENGSVYQSTDGGLTFNPLPSLTSYPCEVSWEGPLASSPDGSFYLGTYSGICKSTDNGSTWSLLAGSSAIGNPAAVAVSANTPSVLYAMNQSGAVYSSPDGGVTWNPGTSPGGSVNKLVVAASNPQVVYAAGSGGVFVSTNGGGTWSPAANLPFSVSAIAVSPLNPAVVYAGGSTASDGFVAKLSADGKNLLWSTFYTGSNGSYPDSVASVASGDVWIAGGTSSADLPVTANAYSAHSANGASFLARISDATASCSYYLNPPSWISYGAETLGFAVTSPSGCAWTASPSDSSWITIQTGAAGTASGTVSAALTANSTSSTRTGNINVGGQAFGITQAASSCAYQLDNTTVNLPAAGGNFVVHLTAGPGCPWSVIPQDSFVSVVSGGSGTGNGTITLSIPPNAGVQFVSTQVRIATQTLEISEADACTFVVSPLTIGMEAASGSINVTTNFDGCPIYASVGYLDWLTITNPRTPGSGTLGYTVTANNTGAPRTAQLTIDNRQFTLTQTSTILNQTITFGVLANRTYGTAPFAVSATASSGLPVSFNSQTTSVCTVSGSQVTLVAVGICTIQATQAGNAGYAPAWPVNQTFHVVAQPVAPAVVSVTPNTGAAASQIFTFQYSSVNSYGYLNTVYMLFNGALSSANGCKLEYLQSKNALYLYTDAGSAMTGPVTPGVAGTLSN
ncbi:MAG: SBBP repeat-containing protein, partial [Bryobacteraceae bacterium]